MPKAKGSKGKAKVAVHVSKDAKKETIKAIGGMADMVANQPTASRWPGSSELEEMARTHENPTVRGICEEVLSLRNHVKSQRQTIARMEARQEGFLCLMEAQGYARGFVGRSSE